MLVAGRCFAAAIACTTAIATAPSAIAAGDAPPAAPTAIGFVMPAPGAFVAAGPVVVAGRLPPNAGYVNLILDGEPLEQIQREGSIFSASFTPASGPHTVEARAGALSATLAFTFLVADHDPGTVGPLPYRYHAPVIEQRCAECHALMHRPTAKAEIETCTSCHRKLAMFYPRVHGPLAAGKCLVCHDPHGSFRPALTVRDSPALCTLCHDQPGSLEHVEQARSKVCYLCHNPHASMNKKLLYRIVK